MNENRMKKSMSSRGTPMNFVKRTKKQMRKTNKSIRNKSIQKCTLLQRNGVQMRDRSQGMTHYPKEKIGSLSEVVSVSSVEVIRGLEPHRIKVPMMYDIMSSRGGDSS